MTADDVNRVAKTYFQKPNRTVGMYIPAKEPQRLAIAAGPAARHGRQGLQGRHRRRRPARRSTRRPANLDAPAQGRRPGRHQGRPAAEEEPRRDGRRCVLTLHYGNEESLKGQTTAAGMLPGLMMAGTKKHDRQALREELDALGIRI